MTESENKTLIVFALTCVIVAGVYFYYMWKHDKDLSARYDAIDTMFPVTDRAPDTIPGDPPRNGAGPARESRQPGEPPHKT